jgi:zinc/manganese transport system substrate-binding protein
MSQRVVVGWAAALVIGLGALAAGCGSDDDAAGQTEAVTDRPTIVVTTPMLGAVVADLVGGSAEVSVVMPNGADPHDFSPSARDIASLRNADLVVENGLQLEENLIGALARARRAGVPVFTATDHIEVREGGVHGHADADPATGGDPVRKGEDDHDHDHGEEDEHSEEEAEHGHEGDDPHMWMDPVAMASVVSALGPVVENRLGIDLDGRTAEVTARMEALDEQVRETLDPIPPAQRRLVSGHESMGYFADRYDFEVVGFLLPSLSSQGEVSAANLAGLRERIQNEDITVIFNETGTPPGVADAIGRETGARVVEIGTHTLPDDGSYKTFITGVASTIAEAYGAN